MSSILSLADLKLLRSLIPELDRIEWTETLQSSVTTHWGVAWDEEMAARDLMQNFRDANQSDLSRIRTWQEKEAVLISAPAQFNLKRLLFLGSEKGDDDIGEYGEGFKAAALALARDFTVEPIMVCGNGLVRIRISDEPVPDTAMRPLLYDFFRLTPALERSVLVLPRCPAKLATAVVGSLRHFFWDENPAVGGPVASEKDMDVFYRRNGSDGLGFYRGLLRCEIPGLPLVFHMKQRFKLIDNHLQRDRDRNAFNERVLPLYYRFLISHANLPVLREIIKLLEPQWPHGHPLLGEAIHRYMNLYGYEPEHAAKLRARRIESVIQPERYFMASSEHWINRTSRDAVAERDALYLKQGRIKVPSYFESLGVTSAAYELVAEAKKLDRELLASCQRQPTPAERHGIGTLTDGVARIYPPLLDLVQRRHYEVLIVISDKVLGELRSKRGYSSVTVLLNESLFRGKLSRAMAIILHEFSHVFGGDGGRSFTDALTSVLEAVMDNPAVVARLEQRWEEVRARVAAERAQAADGVDEALQTLSTEELLALAKRLPRDVIATELAARIKPSSDLW